MDYNYHPHEYRGYVFIKVNYGGSWRIHELDADGEFNVFRAIAFRRTLADAKKFVDNRIEREKRAKKGQFKEHIPND